MKNKILKLIITLLAFGAFSHAENCSDLKLDSEIVFGFFNGVNTAPDVAADALDIIENNFMNTYVSTLGEKIEYTLFYNETEGLADFAETFEQRAKEHVTIIADKYENYWRIQEGNNSTWNKIKGELSKAQELEDSVRNGIKAFAIATISNLVAKSQTTDIMYQEHKDKLECISLHNKKMLIFAHSQGNLFARQAYDNITLSVDKKAVDLIHIAPATSLTRGSHFLVDWDLVINGLGIVGSKPSITHYISSYILRPAGLNGSKDFLGHGLLEIYLNKHIRTSVDIYRAVQNSFDTLEFPHPVTPENNDTIDPNNFDYQTICTDVNFPDDVASYDGVIKAVIDLAAASGKTEDETCQSIQKELDDMNIGGGGDENNGTSPSDPFDFKSECSDVSFPDPIPSELETTINDIVSDAGDGIAASIVCPLIDTAVKAYKLTNGGGLPGG